MSFVSMFFGPKITGIAPTDAQARLSQKSRPFLLDVRQPHEFQGGHISGAKLIPLTELPRRMNELPKDREIICVCHSGNRSVVATRQLTASGYQVLNMNGGMISWERAGLPVKKGMGK